MLFVCSLYGLTTSGYWQWPSVCLPLKGEQRLRLHVAQKSASGSGTDMLDLIEIELTRVRRMAEHADDGFLLYLIDMAILEANRRSRSIGESRDGAGGKTMFAESNGNEFPNNLVADLRIVR
jgi:hypothetical protein